jgi:hypothetical protein
MFITFPRSGHNLLHQLLKHVLQKNFSYCEYYSHCRQIPCVNNAQFQKNHDFDLDLPIDKSVKYIVQYRHPYESIASFYSFDLFHNKIENDHIDTWRNYLNEKLVYYLEFMKKWATPNDPKQFLHVKYSDLIHSTQATLWRVIKFSKLDKKVSKEKTYHSASQIVINRPKHCSEFKFFNENDLSMVNRKAYQFLKNFKIEEIRCNYQSERQVV